MKWSQEALDETEKIPRLDRSMAKKTVEKDVKTQGRDEVTLADIKSVRDKYTSLAVGDEKPE